MKFQRELHGALVAAGITVLRVEQSRNNHLKWFVQRGKRRAWMTTSSTPSCGRSTRNCVALARRLLRRTPCS